MAEGMLKQLLETHGLQIEVTSAGTSAFDGMGASPETLSLLEEIGINMRDHQARRLNIPMIEEADLIFVMEETHENWILSRAPEAKNKIYSLADFDPSFKYEGIGIPDPIGMGDSFYENVGELIHNACEHIVEKLTQTA